MHLLDADEVHDRGPVDPNEAIRWETLEHVLHCPAIAVSFAAHVDDHVVIRVLHPVDIVQHHYFHVATAIHEEPVRGLTTFGSVSGRGGSRVDDLGPGIAT